MAVTWASSSTAVNFLTLPNPGRSSPVGGPIPVPRRPSPPEEMVDHYHSLYMEALTKLFHEHKVSCGLSESHDLRII